jgi:hypothetical protein
VVGTNDGKAPVEPVEPGDDHRLILHGVHQALVIDRAVAAELHQHAAERLERGEQRGAFGRLQRAASDHAERRACELVQPHDVAARADEGLRHDAAGARRRAVDEPVYETGNQVLPDASGDAGALLGEQPDVAFARTLNVALADHAAQLHRSAGGRHHVRPALARVSVQQRGGRAAA